MKELVEVLAKALVDHPDQVVVAQTETDRTVHLQLVVASEDMGKVIGKQGKIANAIRTIVKAAAVKDGRRVHVDIDQ
ncbi:MAG: KH domain-containing protein [Desulfitobacterium hafniense]|nr:KH domain-containing protein [Desulfitobacterium hafniense]